VGAVGGLFAAAALLSLALSVDVRLRTAAFNAAALNWVAAQVDSPTDVVAVCNIGPRAVAPAPKGAYTLHELFYEWAPGNALRWHSGEEATFALFYDACPTGLEADVVVDFTFLQQLPREPR